MLDQLWDFFRPFYLQGALATLPIIMLCNALYHLKTYRDQLVDYVHGRASSCKPKKGFTKAEIAAGLLLSILGAALWPVVILGGIAFLLIEGCSRFFNLPFEMIDRSVISKNEHYMLVSDKEEIRRMAENHRKKEEQKPKKGRRIK